MDQRERRRRKNPRESLSRALDQGGEDPVPLVPTPEGEGDEVGPDPEKDEKDQDLGRTDPGRGPINPREVLSPLSHNGKEAEAGRDLEENIPGDLGPSNRD